MLAKMVTLFQAVNVSQLAFFKQVAAAAIFRALAAITAFALSVSCAQLLGAQQAGIFFLGLSIALVFALTSLVGMDHAILRFIGLAKENDNRQEINQIFSTAFFTVLAVATLCASIIIVFSSALSQHVFAKPELANTLPYFALAIPFISLFFINGYAFQAIGKTVTSICVMQLGATSFLLLGLFFLHYQGHLLTVAKIAPLYLACTALIMTIGLVTWLRQTPHRMTVQRLRISGFWQTLPDLWLVSAISQALPWLPIVVVGVFCSAQEVAYFSAAQRTSLLISFMLMVVGMVVAPRFSAFFHRGEMEKLQQFAKLSTRITIVCSIPVLLFACMMPKTIMQLFGTGFDSASQLLVIMAIGQGINVATGAVGFLLSMCGLQKQMRNIAVFSGCMTLLLTLFFTAVFSVQGAAFATAIGVVSHNLLLMFRVKKSLGFWAI